MTTCGSRATFEFASSRALVPGAALGVLMRVFLMLAGMMAAAASVAAPDIPQLTQYEHRFWREQDGGVRGPNAIAQTQDGYLWIGTDAGLMRFDGANFVPKNNYDGTSIAQWQIGTVLSTRDGSLWIGANGHVARISHDRLVEQYIIAGRVNQLVEDKDGAVWLTQSRANGRQGPLCSVASQTLHCHGKPDIPYGSTSALSADPDGTLWFGSDEGLCHWSPDAPAHCYLHDTLGPTYGLVGVMAILRTRDGTQWLGIAKAGHAAYGLGQLVQGKWQPFKSPHIDGSKLDVSNLLEDADGSLWVGTYDEGVYRIHGDAIDHYARSEGLTDNSVSFIHQDAEGSVWVVTGAGIDYFRKLPISVFSLQQGLPNDSVSSVLAARDGTVWIGNQPLTALRNDRPVPLLLAGLFRGRRTTSLLQDHAGRIWIGQDGNLIVQDLDEKSFHYVTDASGRPPGPVMRIAEDLAQDVWVLTTAPQRLLHVHGYTYDEQPLAQPARALLPDPAGGMLLALNDGSIGHAVVGAMKVVMPADESNRRINAMTLEPDGTLLAATSLGLFIRRGNAQRLVDVQHGMPCPVARSLIRSPAGSVWMLLSCGLLRVDAGEVDRLVQDPDSSIRARLFDATDGFQADVSGFAPAASLAPDGRMWFATTKVAQVIDPARIAPPRPPPPVLIDELLADRVTYHAPAHVALPQGTRDLEVRYAALSFISPRAIRFKYRLDGRDPEWIEADDRRVAFYTDLPPGSYRFRVTASGRDGVWNASEAVIAFDIAPTFYQTRWFAVLCTFVLASALYAAYLVRLKQIDARYRDRLAAKNAERERIARDLHDTLLQSTEGLVLLVQAAANSIGTDSPARAAIDRALERSSALIAEGRDRVQDLRSAGTDVVDLQVSLGAFGREISAQHSTQFNLEVEGVSRQLSSAVADEAYLISREAIGNAFRHAHASAVDVKLAYANTDFMIVVRDDGAGLDLAELEGSLYAGHWGLKGMRERAQRIHARFEIRSRVGDGVEVTLTIPAQAAYAGRRRSRWPWQNRSS